MIASSKPTASQDHAAEVTYRDVRLLIFDTIHKFRRRFGSVERWDEMVAEANLIFIQAYRTCDCCLGAFQPRLKFLIWMRFMDCYLRRPVILAEPSVVVCLAR